MAGVTSCGAPRRSRAEWHRMMTALRAQGMNGAEISRAFGVGHAFVSSVLNDPAGDRERLRKAKARGVCADCGAPTSYVTSGTAKRCAACRITYEQSDEYRESIQKWPRERIIAAIQWWGAIYGESPALSDWNPTRARQLHDEDRAERAERLIARGRIPWSTAVVNRFGRWNLAIAAAGFEPRAAVGTAENTQRRRSMRMKRA